MNRRAFLQSATAVAGSLCFSRMAAADPLGLPVGLQLYSVKDLLAKDYDGTLRQVASIGYKEVELAFPARPGAEIRKSIAAAGLRCPSVHYPLGDVLKKTDEIFAQVQAIGAKYLICPGPEIRDPSRLHLTGDMFKDYPAYRDGLTIDDWRWSGEQLNRLGALAKSRGISMGYHNHNLDFKRYGDVTAFDALAAATDPALVILELDTGWVAAAGEDPVAYMRKYATRIRMLHVKDFARFTPSVLKDPERAAELGRGVIDLKRIFQAAHHCDIQHYFVEQESYEIPVMQALKLDYDYIHALPA